MNCLFVADPVEALNPRSDTSLYMLRECLRRGWPSYWTTPGRVYWHGTSLRAEAFPVAACRKHAVPELGARMTLDFDADVGAVFVRKDPPFDIGYISLCWLLAGYEARVRMINAPSLLLRYHEKMLPLDAVSADRLRKEDMIPTCVSSDVERLAAFVKELDCDRVVVKPWLGYGGRDIHRAAKADFLDSPREHIESGQRWMVQPYFPEVERGGDRRAFFFNGKYFGGFVRLPKKGGYVANLAQGGSAADLPLSDRERALILRVEAWLLGSGIVFAGADFLGGRLSELNITSPTGFSAYEELFGTDPSGELFAAAFGPEKV